MSLSNYPPIALSSMPISIRQTIYRSLSDDIAIKDTSIVNQYAKIVDEAGNHFTVLLSSPETIHLLFRVPCVNIETNTPLEDVIVVAALPRLNLEYLLIDCPPLPFYNRQTNTLTLSTHLD